MNNLRTFIESVVINHAAATHPNQSLVHDLTISELHKLKHLTEMAIAELSGNGRKSKSK